MRAKHPEGLARARAALLSAKLALVLFAQGYARPDQILGVLAIQFNMAVIDRLACGVAPDFDDNGVLVAVLGARLLGVVRSAGPPPTSQLSGALTDCAWALLCLLCVHHARRRLGSAQWVPACLSAAGLLVNCATHAPLETLAMHGARAACFLVLSLMLHAHPPRPEALAGARGFLFFLPLLLTRWAVAWTFASCAVWLLVVQEWGLVRPPEPRGGAYALLPVAADV